VAPVPSTQEEGTKTYYVSQVAAGCEGGRSPIKVYVDYLAAPVLVTSDSVICKGTDIQFNASNAGSNITGLTWVWGNGDSSKGQNPVIHSFDKTGKWGVTATAEYKVCPDKVISRGIMVFPSPSVYLGADTSICPGGVAIILNDFSNAGNTEATWRWSTGSTNSSVKITSPGSYYVKVSINGCYATDTLVVSNDCYMNLPNVFTPNGDGLNDYFFPRQLLTKGLSGFSMEIFNRWGQMIFSTNTLDGSGWDGKLNNVAQPVGVYIYVIDATFKDGQKERHKGNVTLLR
jgi:gliding motility-associated-like protein